MWRWKFINLIKCSWKFLWVNKVTVFLIWFAFLLLFFFCYICGFFGLTSVFLDDFPDKKTEKQLLDLSWFRCYCFVLRWNNAYSENSSLDSKINDCIVLGYHLAPHWTSNIIEVIHSVSYARMLLAVGKVFRNFAQVLVAVLCNNTIQVFSVAEIPLK